MIEIKTNKKITSLLLAAILFVGCATVNDDRTETKARWLNAGQGALIGCVVTGPFCLIPVGPIVGAIIGGNLSVENKATPTTEVRQTTQATAADPVKEQASPTSGDKSNMWSSSLPFNDGANARKYHEGR